MTHMCISNLLIYNNTLRLYEDASSICVNHCNINVLSCTQLHTNARKDMLFTLFLRIRNKIRFFPGRYLTNRIVSVSMKMPVFQVQRITIFREIIICITTSCQKEMLIILFFMIAALHHM